MPFSFKSNFSHLGLALCAALALPFYLVGPVSAQEAENFQVYELDTMTPLAVDGSPESTESAALPGSVSIEGMPSAEDVLTIGFGGPGGPGGPGGHGGPGPGGFHKMGGGCMSSLMKGEHALTDDQFEKLYALKNDMMDKMGPRMVEMFSLERQLKDVLTSANIDAKKAAALKDKITAAKADMANIGLEHRIAVMETLTAEQRKDLRSAMIKGSMRGFGGGHHFKGKAMMRMHHSMRGPR